MCRSRAVSLVQIGRTSPVHFGRRCLVRIGRTSLVHYRTANDSKRVLVTGGGGSIGSELCRQILACKPARLIVLGHGENSIFEITEELKAQAAALRVELVPVIAGVRFFDRLAAVFAEQQPQIVFHAAVLPSVVGTCR